MADYSKRALGRKGIPEQEKMRVFLGCEQAPPGIGTYDFRKGKVRFENKHSAPPRGIKDARGPRRRGCSTNSGVPVEERGTTTSSPRATMVSRVGQRCFAFPLMSWIVPSRNVVLST